MKQSTDCSSWKGPWAVPGSPTWDPERVRDWPKVTQQMCTRVQYSILGLGTLLGQFIKHLAENLLKGLLLLVLAWLLFVQDTLSKIQRFNIIANSKWLALSAPVTADLANRLQERAGSSGDRVIKSSLNLL